jgi:hypothetical protein
MRRPSLLKTKIEKARCKRPCLCTIIFSPNPIVWSFESTKISISCSDIDVLSFGPAKTLAQSEAAKRNGRLSRRSVMAFLSNCLSRCDQQARAIEPSLCYGNVSAVNRSDYTCS